jgi:uncharacterized OsmC-like protein
MEEREGRIVSIDLELLIDADLDDQQRQRLLEAAETCRISRAVRGAVAVNLR